MPYDLFDYVDANGKNRFKSWWEKLQKPQKGKLRARIDFLRMHGDALFPEILAGTRVGGILKLKVHGNVQLRPLLCRGPHNMAKEYTLLFGATEKDDKWSPSDAPEQADACRSTVANVMTRRTKHERVA